MPGAYAHITLVNELREPQRLEAISGFPDEAISALLEYFKFCELGAVGPDYPYLAIGDSDARKWADIVHYTLTGHVVQAGVKRLQSLGGETQRKCLAWLMGYTAHVTTDVTIHPVVELKVGPYQGNEKGHRICEMHQDAYIFQRLNLGEVGISEHLDSFIIPDSEFRCDHSIRFPSRHYKGLLFSQWRMHRIYCQRDQCCQIRDPAPSIFIHLCPYR